MPYEVLSEWSGNVIKYLYRYRINQQEIANGAEMSESYLCRLLHMENPRLSSCEKVDRSVAQSLEERDFDSSDYLELQKGVRSALARKYESCGIVSHDSRMV